MPPFLQLKERILQEGVAAEDNVRFLACLEGPCQQLSKATPQQIPTLLPQVLNCIRMVWSLSKYYNTPERITSLLQKLSNEIINRCCSALKVDDILTGNVAGVMEMLQQSMAAGMDTDCTSRGFTGHSANSTTNRQSCS
jgi:dynein heavy chain